MLLCLLKACSSAGSDRFGLALAVLCTWALQRVDRGGVHIQRRHINLEQSNNIFRWQ